MSAMKIRKAVQRCLEAEGRSTYWLAEECHKRGLAKTPVYEWLADKRDITTENLEVILDVLGMLETICQTAAKPSKPARKPPRKRS